MQDSIGQKSKTISQQTFSCKGTVQNIPQYKEQSKVDCTLTDRGQRLKKPREIKLLFTFTS